MTYAPHLLQLSWIDRFSTTRLRSDLPGAMPPRPPSPQAAHPIVKAAAALLVLAAAGAGVWAGSRGGTPRPVPIDPATAQEGLFLPGSGSESPALLDASRGAALFEERCAECHTVGGGDRNGPDLARAALLRDPTWVRAMVASPDSMFRTDSVAQWVLKVHEIEPAQATGENPDLMALVAFLRTFAAGR